MSSSFEADPSVANGVTRLASPTTRCAAVGLLRGAPPRVRRPISLRRPRSTPLTDHSSNSVCNAGVEVFHDGDCPLCNKEIDMLKRMDRKHGHIRFTDIAAPGFDPARVGLTHADLMDRIHARLPDGTLIEGVEVFRRLYSAVGFGWLVAPTRLPGVSHLLDAGYRTFAKNRLKWTGRCEPDGSCRLPDAAS